MKHRKKRRNKSVGLYVFGALVWLWEHMYELIMVAAFLGMLIAYNAFDSGVISYTTAILFIAVLLIVATGTLKILLIKNDR